MLIFTILNPAHVSLSPEGLRNFVSPSSSSLLFRISSLNISNQALTVSSEKTTVQTLYTPFFHFLWILLASLENSFYKKSYLPISRFFQCAQAIMYYKFDNTGTIVLYKDATMFLMMSEAPLTIHFFIQAFSLLTGICFNTYFQRHAFSQRVILQQGVILAKAITQQKNIKWDRFFFLLFSFFSPSSPSPSTHHESTFHHQKYT